MVYIKGFEMPYSCEDCKLKKLNVFGMQCCIFHKQIVDDLDMIRHDMCPLVEEI